MGYLQAFFSTAMIVVALAAFGGSATGLSVGVAPPVLDAGQMLPGESRSMDFFLTSDHDEDLLVDVSSKRAKRGFFIPTKDRSRYAFKPDNASEEDISGWLVFLEKSFMVPPEKRLVYLSGGGMANANQKVGVILNVPEDAEPGYHAGYVSPYPSVSLGGGGTGLGIISVVEMAYVVQVVGEARREIEVAGMDFRMISPGRGRLDILVKNTGSVTVSVIAEHIEISDRSGSVLQDRSSNEKYIKPGRVERLETYLDTRGMEGSYGAKAYVEWVTGETSYSGEFEITDYVPMPAVTGEVVGPAAPAAFPIWILPVILIFIALGVYWRSR
jgi:hypothetical protein